MGERELRHATPAIANHAVPQRPDLLLVGRAGQALTAVAEEVRAAGATVCAITCDLADLTDVGKAAKQPSICWTPARCARWPDWWPTPFSVGVVSRGGRRLDGAMAHTRAQPVSNDSVDIDPASWRPYAQKQYLPS